MGINIIEKGKILSLDFQNYLDDNDFLQFKEIFIRKFNEQKTFAMILDMTNVSGIKLSLVMDMVSLLREFENEIKTYLIASSIIVSQDWIKNIINGLFTIKKPTKPNLVTKNKTEAVEYCEDYLLITK